MKKKEIAIPNLKKELADREKLSEQSRDIAKSLWTGKLTANESKAVNHICLLYGLDPLLKQIVVLGGNFYITKSGILNIAYTDPNPPDSIEVIPATPQEREHARVPDTSHFWKAFVYKKNSNRPFIEFGEASEKNVNLHNKDWRSLSDMAKTRAVNRTLRNAYRIGFTSLEEVGYGEGQVVNITPESAPQKPAETGYPSTNTSQTIDIPSQKKDPTQNENMEAKLNENGKKITRKQQEMLFATAKRYNLTHDDLKYYLKTAYSIESTNDILAMDFNAILLWISGGEQL